MGLQTVPELMVGLQNRVSTLFLFTQGSSGQTQGIYGVNPLCPEEPENARAKPIRDPVLRESQRLRTRSVLPPSETQTKKKNQQQKKGFDVVFTPVTQPCL